jgi:putative tryptophan/tyrosine transport system substrate-binding protein
MLKRREFVTLVGATAAWPLAARAQKSMPVIGFLNGASYELSAYLVEAFRQGLGVTGYVEGHNVLIEYRSADGQYDRLPALAADLVQREVNIVAATGTPTGLPAKAATATIPVVFVTGSDPVEQGLVTSLSRPEGNLTGATTLAVELGQKRLELLHELVPSALLTAVLLNATGPNFAAVSRDLQAAARKLGLSIHILHASTVPEVEAAFAAMVELHADALVIGTDTFFNSESALLATQALSHAIPAMYQYREFTAAGGLVSYAGSITDAYHIAGVYAGRILKGEKVANLPVQQSTKAELFMNLKTAKALGLSVPPTLLARADEVIE